MISLTSARGAGVPLVAIQTNDNAQTQKAILRELNGKAETRPLLVYILGSGLTALNAIGQTFLKSFCSEEPSTLRPDTLLTLLRDATPLPNPDNPNKALPTYIFIHNPQLLWQPSTEGYIYILQGIWSLRDVLKRSGSQLILLVPPGTILPTEISNDVVVLRDTLPDTDEINAISDGVLRAAKISNLKADDLTRINDALLGLPAFAAEQALAMSIRKGDNGNQVDAVELWARKRQMIGQTPGLSVWSGGETFDDVGGYENVKTYMRRLLRGRTPIKAIAFSDEVEKDFPSAIGGDNTGVSQAYLRKVLTYMQDSAARGVIFIGAPGSGKSAIAKAAGNDVGIPTIALNFGDMKGSLVGQSEERLGKALDVVSSIAQGQVLFIATCNSIAVLPPELRRRYNRGTFYFPMPDAAARASIWAIYRRMYPELAKEKLPADAGWTGAEIRNCAELAYDLKISLRDAAEYIVPYSRSSAKQLEKLNQEASGCFINADKPGVFEYVINASRPAGERVIDLE